MGSLFAGPAAVARAAGLIGKHPKLVALAMLPALVALLLSIVGIWAAVAYGDDLVAWAWPEPEGGVAYGLWWALTLVARISSAALAIFVTPWLVMLVGLPLCEPLAEKADALLGGPPPEGSFVAGILDALTSTLGILLIGLAGAVGFFLLGLIPGVAIFTGPFVAFVWTPLFLAFDLFDSSLARRQHRFRRKLGFTLGRPVRAVSLGLTGTLLISIPVVNLLGLPLAVLAGVILVRDAEKKGALPPTPVQANT